ncbi:MAG: hypothetical protein ISN29_02975 [Gammaproteobacteria bacterium AqS3]|nr:hypothetical protein [Gammaproteobacteria bacterium AqS3]
MRNIPDYLSEKMSKLDIAVSIIEDESGEIETEDVSRLVDCHEELTEAIGRYIDDHESMMRMYADKLAELSDQDDPDFF